MSEKLRKLQILRWWMLSEFEAWKRQVWNRDLDELYCCDGRECACAGQTIDDMWRS